MGDKKAPGKGEVTIYKFYNVQGDKVTRNKRDCPVASVVLQSLLTLKVPKRPKSKKAG